jgi:multiple sugar transport system permease protein
VLALFFAGLFFPPQTFMVPVYILTRKLGVYDTYFGLMLVHIAYSLPFGVLTLSRFFSTIPSTLIDAARTDGASETHILVRIVWPLSANAIGAVAVFQFTWIWNDYFWGLVMTQSRNVQPVMVGITSAIGRLVFDWNGQSASSAIALIPPLLVFIFLQRIFVEGVRMGGVK